MSKTDVHNTVDFHKTLLREISEQIFDFIAVVTATDRKIIFLNEMGAKLFGFKNSGELLGKNTTDLSKKLPDQKMLKIIDKQINSRGYFTDEIEFITTNGQSFWGCIQLTSFFANGEDYRLLQIEKDEITMPDSEKLLKETQHFGAIMDYTSIGVIILNSEFKIVLMNNSILNLFGYKKKELSGATITTLIPSSLQEKYIFHLTNYLANSENQSTEFRMELCALKKDKTEFPVEISIGNFKTNKEDFAILFVNDITLRKKGKEEVSQINSQLEIKVKERTDELDLTIARLEEQIRETEKTKARLEEGTQFQKAVLDSSMAMIIATDRNGIITLFNKAAEDLLGYKADEIIGKCDPTLFHDSEQIRKRALKYSEELNREISQEFEVFVAKSRDDIPNRNEWIYIKKDGTRFPVSLSVTAFRNNQNELTGFMGVAMDISETKRSEEKLKKALAVETELNEMKSRFVSIASHEFRTPLSTILSSTYLLQKYFKTEEQPKREKHIGRVISSVSLLTGMLDDLLNVGKIEEGKVLPKFSHFNIKENIEGAINEIRHIRQKGQQIIYKHTGKKQVWLDPSMLTHIVINLLSNAIKFSRENSCITVETNITGLFLQLTVKDNGIGISKEDQPHLFELFFRSNHSAHIQGTGLGLYIVRKYTELLNGKITCKSEPGKGTRFLIRIQMRSQ